MDRRAGARSTPANRRGTSSISLGRHLLDLRAALDWLEPDPIAATGCWRSSRSVGRGAGTPTTCCTTPTVGCSLARPTASTSWPGPGRGARRRRRCSWALRIDRRPRRASVRPWRCRPATAAPPSPAMVGDGGDRAETATSHHGWPCSSASTTTATCCSRRSARIFVGARDRARTPPPLGGCSQRSKRPSPVAAARARLVWLSRTRRPARTASRACAARLPDVELRDDDLFLFDRFFHVVDVARHRARPRSARPVRRQPRRCSSATRTSRSPSLWRAGSRPSAQSSAATSLDDAGHRGARVVRAPPRPPSARLPTPAPPCRSAGATRPPTSIAELAGPGAGEIADAVMRAVLALHDDQVLDAGRPSPRRSPSRPTTSGSSCGPTCSSSPPSSRPAATTTSGRWSCSAPASEPASSAGVGFRFRDQQAWIDDVLAAATRPSSTLDQIDRTSTHRARRCRPTTPWPTPDAAAASVGAAHRAGTPSHRPNDAVVDLVAQGLTNPQIAERLVMSRATVKTHVSHCLTKLGMTTRSRDGRRSRSTTTDLTQMIVTNGSNVARPSHGTTSIDQFEPLLKASRAEPNASLRRITQPNQTRAASV